ncbi:hypothetical protein DMENIID0001_026240 [Sergentomyia squamirostris]
MGAYRKFTFLERRDIIQRYCKGQTMNAIAEFYGKTRQAVSKVIKCYGEECRVHPKKSSGRPRITTEKLDRRIVSISDVSPLMFVPKIRGQLLQEGREAPSMATIRRRLYEVNKKGRVAKKVPLLSKINQRKRMQFYLDHVVKGPEFWEKVLWTDEFMIRMTYSHGRMYVLRRNGEMLSYKCTHRTVKGAGQGVMVWGCMAASSVGRLVMLEGKVNSAVYLKLMQEVIIPEGRRIIGDDFILQQDNAPIHKAKIITKYLAEAGANVMTWPPQSPDLSPIENLWAMLKIKIAEQRNPILLRI